MKYRIVISVITLFSTLYTVAQPVLTRNNLPITGNVLSFSFQDTTGVHEGASGANVVWDFSDLSATGIPFKIVYESPTASEFFSDYPLSTLYRTDSSGIKFQHYNSSDDSLVLIGDISLGAATKWVYFDGEKRLTFPLSYTETISDTFYGQRSHADFAHSGEPGFRNGALTVEYDGYGQLKLPTKDFENAIRVKTTRTYKDSLCLLCNLNINRIDQVVATSYDWYVSSMKFPILSIEYIDITINYAIKSYNKHVRLYDENYTTITGLTNTEFSTSILPNPAHSWVTVKNPDSFNKISIYNLQGIEVLQSNTFPVNISTLTDGIYIVKIHSHEGTITTSKFIKN